MRRQGVAVSGRHLSGDELGRRLPVGEVNHLLHSYQIPSYCRVTGQAVNQAQLQGLLTGPDQSTEQIRMLLQPITPPLAHLVDELTVGGIQYRLPELPLILALGLEGIEEGLVLTGGIGATLDTQLVKGLDEAETRRSNADGADQAGLVGKDLISRRRYIIGTGCPHI